MHKPFADLARLRGARPEPGPADVPSAAPELPAATAPPPAPSVKIVPRAVVRMERAGRGGKEVTVIEQLDLTAAEREPWLKALKAALGCGGVIEGAALVLQGDHRKRLPAILTARGVKKVITG